MKDKQRRIACRYQYMRGTVGGNKGSITVFLTLILVVVLSLIATCIENARVSVASSMVERSLACSVDATMAEYYRPLYEDYKLFYMDKGLTAKEEKKQIIRRISDYMEIDCTTKDPYKENTRIGTDLYQVAVGKIKIEDLVRATDYKGQTLLEQALQYEKYAMPTEGISKLLGCKETTEQKKAAAEVIEQEAKIFEKFEDANEVLMEFMEVVEGIECKNGMKYREDGNIQVRNSFAKKLCFFPVTKKNVGVSSQIVWNSTKNMYYTPRKKLNKLAQLAASLYQEKQKEEEKMQKEATKDDTETCTGEVELDKEKKDKEKKKDEKEQKEEEDEKRQKEASEKKKKRYEKIREKVKKVVDATINKQKEAIKLIGKLKKEKTTLEKEVKNYADTVKEKKEQVSKEEAKVFQDNLSDLKKNLSSVEGAIAMKEQLDADLTILTTLKEQLEIPISDSLDQLGKIHIGWEQQALNWDDYDISTLEFTYGKMSREEVPNPMDAREQMSASILDLTVPASEKISKKYILQGDYYYETYGGNGQGEVRAVNKSLQQEDLGGLFGDFSTIVSGEDGSATDSVLNNVLYQGYIKDYFASFCTQERKFSQCPLDYEQEYILCGNKSDRENLKSVLQRLVLLRTPINFTYLLTDQVRKSQAYATALALVGFTGIDAVVRVTQYLILATWSYEESLVDVAALMQGAKIPLVKAKNNFQLSFVDICTISKSKIQSKAKQLGNKAGKMGMDYEEYLQLLLLFEKQEKKLYRSMDLIEENVKLRHSDLFSFEQCIYSIETSCDYVVPAKFIAVGFMQGWNYQDSSWAFHTSQGYAY